ncbi:acetolactate decarboxylase [Vibrio sp. Isolate23]|uniref:acetolactate decarboxylase n=1 Tax=Vibrio TaxID=662 RepID=UPI001EFC577F|nr:MULTISPECIES: acetolactate decarboxylase [Vibrio]MCG9681549.1 acetolactate decarboxylase [Vibrio sp. Isolate23]USD34638.1 acetolactate decarboxylase [Vibrio sp. SCSIO 43186]USD47705.1 acetolactate decarboxylase [Vibrio sp. SCSIO 43145]USD71763.1 acetolactate decarboxylase [Vibrio sp. SCSIO 43139]USD98666.1 hypothetical protein CTT30_21910 [Vibrio coralliilyticus]
MKQILTILFAYCTALPAFSFDHHGEIFQAGVTGATMTGAYTGSTTYREIVKHGNLGLGTANGIRGEMVFLDGEVFITRDGQGHTEQPSLDTKTPFSIVSNFYPHTVFSLENVDSKAHFTRLLKPRLVSDNVFYVMRIEGRFNLVRARSITKPAGHNDLDLKQFIADNEQVNEYQNITGTMVVFKSPTFAYPMTVPGYHIHFISTDRKYAGHVYDFSIDQASLSLQAASKFSIVLPDNAEFLAHKVEKVDHKVIHHVESGGKG